MLAMNAVFLLLGLFWFASAEDIVGCGGFVETSETLAKLRKASDPKLDYSHITVKLRTLEGLVKDRTQCAPNGYYFLPVYEKGSFVLQVDGPEGWSFAPSEVRLVIDQNGCYPNEDINFQITGFTLSGKVTGAAGITSCKTPGDGPAGVKISLAKIGDEPGALSVLTQPGGHFSFRNLLAGAYRIQAAHPSFDVTPKGQHEVHVGWANAEVNDLFSVSGYSVEGSVLSKGNPVLGVQIFLHSNDVSEILCPQGPGDSPWPDQAICHATSDSEGRFKFSSVPCGDYTLVPFYKGETTIFDVSPESIHISVGHENLVVRESFQVTGFSVGGRVVNANGDGIGNVKIYLDNVERALTDSNGFYKLDQVTSTTYNIFAAKDRYKFPTFENFMVLPNMASLPTIEPTHYNLCGLVRMLGHFGKRQVALTHGPASVKPQNKRVSDTGEFCFEVPPGEYRLSPITTTAEQEAGLLFSPEYVDVTVSEPVSDVVFSQTQVSVSGSVKCKDGCGTRLSISLTPSRGQENNNEVQRVRLSETGMFKFENVFPGRYQLEVASALETEKDDEWCWEQKKIDVRVLTSDVEDLTFVQKGYWLRIQSSHPASAFTLQKNHDPVPLQIVKGWQEVCVESPGVHELHFVRPCVFFGKMSYTFDTSNPQPIQLTGEKYLLTGQIHVDSLLYADASTLDRNLLVEILNKRDSSLIDSSYARLVAAAGTTSSAAIYEYAHWAELGDQLIFTPRYERAEESRSPMLLFYPREQHVYVAVDGCQPRIPDFSGRPGVYVTGEVSPPLEAVDITVISTRESKVGRLAAGEVAVRVATGADGSFVAGPLYDDTEYEVKAEKPGYHLRSAGNNSFICRKLSQIVVDIKPGDGAEDILPSVLLSLSGDDGYRRNAAALQGVVFVFDNLFPGSFYLRPLLKEYRFSPAAQALEVGAGESLNITVIAHRSAYSVFGSVTSLSGRPEEGISVEARCEAEGYYEETVTDVDGRYRLRGLVPKTAYVIKVVIKDDGWGVSKLERASPRSYLVEVGSNDTRGIDFVIFENSPTSSLTGVVEGKDLEKWQPYLEVLSSQEPRTVVREIPLPLSHYFEVQGLPRGKYIVRVIPKLPSPTHKFDSAVVEIDMETTGHVHVDSLSILVEEHRHKQDLAPAPVLPVVVGILVIAVFVTMPSLKDVYHRASGAPTGAPVSFSTGQRETRKTNPTRRIRTY